MAYKKPKKLIEWMKKNGKTDVDLASVIGTSQNTADRKLNGLSDFKMTECKAICTAWNIGMDYFE